MTLENLVELLLGDHFGFTLSFSLLLFKQQLADKTPKQEHHKAGAHLLGYIKDNRTLTYVDVEALVAEPRDQCTEDPDAGL